MKENFHDSFEHTIQFEGGYVNDPVDKGGETNLGVTKGAWAQYIGRPVQDGEMRKLTKETVEPFYKKGYWDKCRCDELPAGVDYAMFDFAVNAGPSRAIKFMQQAVGVTADGAIGPKTMEAISKAEPLATLAAFTKIKTEFYNAIVARDPSQARFIKGWLRRVAGSEQTAKSMIA